jgi:thiamine pyrophosphate-dependent acetolactate synthase large subunit-like protein
MTQTVARLLAESLEAHDVDQVYCVPGESYVGLTSALIDRNSIRVIVCRHEGGAGYMAVADGRLRDRAGVAMVSRGPGLSNAMVSLHSAYHDATPVVMLIGQVERRDFGRLALQAFADFPVQEFLRAIGLDRADLDRLLALRSIPDLHAVVVAKKTVPDRARFRQTGPGGPAHP